LQGQVEWLPAPDVVTDTQIVKIRQEFSIMISLTTPPSLDELEWWGKWFLLLSLLYNQGTALKID